jgi:ATP-dependent DNA helicase RecG
MDYLRFQFTQFTVFDTIAEKKRMGCNCVSTITHIANPKEFMELAVETMRSSISESRSDKSSPLVGAVLVMPDGRIVKACRGEFSDGDHAEYTLLERKLSSDNLTGSVLFCTLEPCAIGARKGEKVPCAKRIVDRRISKVWIGTEDPDPLVNGKGIQYLQDNGVSVELFDREFQDSIRQANADFITGAVERASRLEDEPVQEHMSQLELPVISAALDDLNTEEIVEFISRAEIFDFSYDSNEFYRAFCQLKYLDRENGIMHPTGLGILLFGKNPQLLFPQAVIRATYTSAGRKEDIATFSGSLPKQVKDSLGWFRNMIGRQIDRSSAQRVDIYDYPEAVVRESIINALAHRSYEIKGASVYLEISDDSIIIRSPGGPAKPISMERVQKLDAPYFSRNPKITYAFEKLRLSENRGLGFKTIRNLPSQHNLPLPTVTYDEPYLTFTFSRAYGIGAGDERLSRLSKTEIKGFDYIRLNTPVTRKAYEDYIGTSQKTAARHLTHFIELNLVEKVGSGTKTVYALIQ